MKLSSEERDDLRDIMSHEGFKALEKELAIVLDSIRRKIFQERVDLEHPLKIALVKSKIEGAEELSSSLKQRLQKIKSG